MSGDHNMGRSDPPLTRAAITTDELARQVGATGYTNRHYKGETAYAFGPAMLAEFVKLIKEQERERCARICDAWVKSHAEATGECSYATCDMCAVATDLGDRIRSEVWPQDGTTDYAKTTTENLGGGLQAAWEQGNNSLKEPS